MKKTLGFDRNDFDSSKLGFNSDIYKKLIILHLYNINIQNIKYVKYNSITSLTVKIIVHTEDIIVKQEPIIDEIMKQFEPKGARYR